MYKEWWSRLPAVSTLTMTPVQQVPKGDNDFYPKSSAYTGHGAVVDRVQEECLENMVKELRVVLARSHAVR